MRTVDFFKLTPEEMACRVEAFKTFENVLNGRCMTLAKRFPENSLVIARAAIEDLYEKCGGVHATLSDEDIVACFKPRDDSLER